MHCNNLVVIVIKVNEAGSSVVPNVVKQPYLYLIDDGIVNLDIQQDY